MHKGSKKGSKLHRMELRMLKNRLNLYFETEPYMIKSAPDYSPFYSPFQFLKNIESQVSLEKKKSNSKTISLILYLNLTSHVPNLAILGTRSIAVDIKNQSAWAFFAIFSLGHFKLEYKSI